MIEMNTGGRCATANMAKTAHQAAEKPSGTSPANPSAKVDTVELGNKQDAPVTYAPAARKKLNSSEISALKAQADQTAENLRKLVEQLILRQNKNYKIAEENASPDPLAGLGITAADIDAAKLAISEDGEFGVKAVSDRLVNFAIAVSNGDKSKLSELVSAIDEGFAAAKEALGGSLPEISRQTYDETMKKLKEWAAKTDE